MVGALSLSLFKTLVAGDTQYSSIRDDASARERGSNDVQGERSSLSSPCFSNPVNQFFLSTRQFTLEIQQPGLIQSTGSAFLPPFLF